MPVPVFIGDEVTAAGYRLAGMDTRLSEGAAADELLQAVRAEAPPLVLITAEAAGQIPEGRLLAAIRALDPPILIVADAAGRVPVPDVVERIRARVGLS